MTKTTALTENDTIMLRARGLLSNTETAEIINENTLIVTDLLTNEKRVIQDFFNENDLLLECRRRLLRG